MSNHIFPQKSSWLQKFRNAFRGLAEGMRGQTSFLVHFFVAIAVIVVGVVVKVNQTEWCLLAICIAGVLTAEMFNSSLESMAKAVTDEPNHFIGDSLDMASAAVLLASLGAATVGLIIFINRLGVMLAWWADK
jgi:diacylglycerol kinase